MENNYVELGTKLPEKYWDKIVIVDRDKKIYRFSSPVEVEGHPGFYYIPGLENYAIARDGILINLVSGRYRTWSVTKSTAKHNGRRMGYRVSHCLTNNGKRTGVSRHRLLALTFIPFNASPVPLVVNHINGVPGDDRIENLEWCTYSENNQHAYDTGLVTTTPILYWNTLTNETMDFKTIFACSKYLGLSFTCVKERSLRPNVEWSDGMRFKVNDGNPWPEIIERVTTTRVRQIAALDIFANVVTIFQDAKAAEKVTGVGNKTVLWHCERSQDSPINGFNFRYFPVQVDFPKHCERSLAIYRKFPKGLKTMGIIVRNAEGVEIDFLESANLFSEKYGVPMGTLYGLLRIGRYKDLLLEKFIPNHAPIAGNSY